MKKINNNHGFTLVELLAVIVVLAIVMLLAVQAVLPQMEKARRQTLALDAQTAIEAANTYLMNKSLSDPDNGFPTSGSKCIDLQTLINEGYFTAKGGTYVGSVQVTKQSSNSNYLFKVWLKKDNLVVAGAGSDNSINKKIEAKDNDDDSGNDVKTYNATTHTTNVLTKCGSTS